MLLVITLIGVCLFGLRFLLVPLIIMAMTILVPIITICMLCFMTWITYVVMF